MPWRPMPKGWVTQGEAELMVVVVMATRIETPNALTYWPSTSVTYCLTKGEIHEQANS